MTLHIIGAGMAGLIAARMLQRHGPVLFEAQAELPDNHGALLRFRTDAVARETGIPFRKVHAVKAVKARGRLWREAHLTPDLHNRYSLKVTGEVRDRSILNLISGERYIAPDDFLARLAEGLDIRYGSPFLAGHLAFRERDNEVPIVPIISTIPMPALMKLAHELHGNRIPLPEFRARAVWSITVILPPSVDVYQTVYYPERQFAWYRASITGRKLILEYAMDPQDPSREDGPCEGGPEGDVLQVFEDFGLDDELNPLHMSGPTLKHHHYGKLLPTDDDARQRFILAMTDWHGVYSLGRFATWRQLLLDDLVKDVRFIERLIDQRGSYARRMEAWAR